jgi:acyl-CoA thioesterase-1
MVAEYGRRAVAQQVAAVVLILLGLMGRAAAAPLTLLTLGDSLSAGYGLPAAQGFEAQLAAALHTDGFDVTIMDGAVSGDTSAGGRARIGWLLGGQKPDAAIVELGGNDGLRGLPASEMQQNLTAILDQLARDHIPTLLSGMYPPPNLGPDYTRQFRAVFDQLSKRPGLFYDPFFLQGVALHPALLQADGLHPNAAGVKVVVARIKPLVEHMLRSVKQ